MTFEVDLCTMQRLLQQPLLLIQTINAADSPSTDVLKTAS